MEFLGSLLARLARACLLLVAAGAAHAQALDADVAQQVRGLALAGSPHVAGVTRVEVEVGRLDPRLRLAPCQRIEPHLPPGTRLWGRTRVGLRCTQGPSAWNVYLPVTVKAFGPAWVAAVPLVAGSVVAAADLAQAEVDLAEDSSAAVTQRELIVGRTLARALDPGQGVRQAHLKLRQWFAAGETVRVVALGAGFRIAGEGQALTPGLEGQPARVRTDSGRVLTGMPVGERRMEMAL
jgi:flagella basal body P-ring formation protein FlgA